MSGGPEWFAPKRVGLGSGLPIAWQGWVLTIGMIAIVTGAGILFGEQPLILFSIIVPVTAIFMLIAAKTTRGGWRWRTVKEDD